VAAYVNGLDIMPHPRMKPRRAYHHGDLANALIEVAVQAVAAEGGVEGFSMSEAARAVGVDPASVYRHFTNKADLLSAVARRGFVRMAEEMDRAVAGESSPVRRIRALGKAYVRFAAENPAHFRVMFGPHGAGRRGPRFSMNGPGGEGKSPFEMLVGALENLERSGESTVPPKRAALAAWSVVHGLASLVVDGVWRPATPRALDAALDDVIAAMVRGLRG
jgi:AcrR family transcriptional regulator